MMMKKVFFATLLMISISGSNLRAEDKVKLAKKGIDHVAFDVVFVQADGMKLPMDSDFLEHVVFNLPIISGGVFGTPDANQERFLLFPDANNQIQIDLNLERKKFRKAAKPLREQYTSRGVVAKPSNTKIARFGTFAYDLQDTGQIVGTSLGIKNSSEILMLVYFSKKSTVTGQLILGEETYNHNITIPKKGFYWLRSKEIDEDVFLIDRVENFKQVDMKIHMKVDMPVNNSITKI